MEMNKLLIYIYPCFKVSFCAAISDGKGNIWKAELMSLKKTV
jgi:hypothetical protein